MARGFEVASLASAAFATGEVAQVSIWASHHSDCGASLGSWREVRCCLRDGEGRGGGLCWWNCTARPLHCWLEDVGGQCWCWCTPPPIMRQLRPAETGYLDGPLPAPDMTATPKSGNEPPTTDSTCNHNTWVRLGWCKMTSDTYGSVTATDPANTAVSGLQDPVNMAVSALQLESTKRASTPELRSSALQHESTKRASIPNYGHPPHVREGYHYSYGILRYTVI